MYDRSPEVPMTRILPGLLMAGLVCTASAGDLDPVVSYLGHGAEVMSFPETMGKKEGAGRLIDGSVQAYMRYATGGPGKYPLEFVIRLAAARRYRITAASFDNWWLKNQDELFREVEVFAGDSPKGPWTSVGVASLTQERGVQSFSLAPREASHVRLLVRSSHGGTWAQTQDFRVHGTPVEGSLTGELDATATSSGARLVSYTSQWNPDDGAAAYLFLGAAGKGHGWESQATYEKPQEFVVALHGAWKLTRAEVNPAADTNPNQWTREVRIEVGASAEGPWKAIGTSALAAEDRWQGFALEPTRARFVKVVSLRSGRKDYHSMGGVKVFGVRVGDGAPTPGEGPGPEEPEAGLEDLGDFPHPDQTPLSEAEVEDVMKEYQP
jgi:hypothetical protein